jgi:SAM-dependent methyltransferase
LNRFVAAFLLMLGALPAAPACAAEAEPRITEETPYVPSPRIVVDTMLRMAGVNAKDFLIDLGSGDGRIIITAAKELRARGFGVDYDPRLVKLATDNAAREGVSDSTAFYQQDIFKTDLGQASVVTMYLLPEYNAVLKPRLLALRPGTRIVSHDYGIGDWEPDAQETIPVPEKPVGALKQSTIYAWVVPAQVAGRWRSRVQTARGITDLEVDIAQHNQHFTGSARLRGREVPIERPFLKSSYLSFRVEAGGETLLFQGHVSNGRITGEQVRGERHIRWRALKVGDARG